MKTCKDCKVSKPLSDFYVNGKNKKTGKLWYNGRCRECHNFKFRPRTGRISSTRFKKGSVPWSKQAEGGRHSLIHKEWIEKVLKRDCHACQECNSTEKLDTHHIKSWNSRPDLRFDLDNGITLCSSCHGKIHANDEKGFKKGHTSWNKGTIGVCKAWNKGIKATEEAKAKMRGPRSNFVPWNKGLKGAVTLSKETRKKMSDAHKGIYNPGSGFLKGNTPWNKGKKMNKKIEEA